MIRDSNKSKKKLHPAPFDRKATEAIKRIVAKNSKLPPAMPPSNLPPSERRIVRP